MRAFVPVALGLALASGGCGSNDEGLLPTSHAFSAFRTRGSSIVCVMTGNGRWTGFACVRPKDGTYARMTGRDLSTERPVRVRAGTDHRLRGFRARGAIVIRPGRSWISSDAELVKCSVGRAAVTCRHWRDTDSRLASGASRGCSDSSANSAEIAGRGRYGAMRPGSGDLERRCLTWRPRSGPTRTGG